MLLLLVGCTSEPSLTELNFAPVVEILIPTEGALYAEGAAVPFWVQARSEDAEIDVDDLSILWQSDLVGDLTPVSYSYDLQDGVAWFERAEGLPVGIQWVTVTVEAPNGTEPVQDTVRVTVVQNTPPTVQIDFPASGEVFDVQDPVEVRATVSDGEQALDTLGLYWSLNASAVNGAAQNPTDDGSASLLLDSLGVGAHLVSLQVEDSAGATASVEVDFSLVERDADGDGFDSEALGGNDCDDGDAAIHPDATEVCDDGVDNDCDGLADDDDPSLDLASATPWYEDDDLDGFGDPSTETLACLAPPYLIADTLDCDDTDPLRYPGAPERCNGLEDACAGLPADESDQDADGYAACTVDAGGWQGDPFVVGGEDCDDSDPALTPADLDGDSWSSCDGDCDDAANGTYPGAPEVCDGLNTSCAVVLDPLETDDDLDGYVECTWDVMVWSGADPGVVGGDDCDDTDPSLTPVDGDGDLWSTCDGDCLDVDLSVYPSAPELCDGLDNACAGAIGADEVDNDGDGHVECAIHGGGWDGVAGIVGGLDCDDLNAAVHPAATEVCDPGHLVDEDCDGLIDDADPDVDAALTGSVYYFDADKDGYGDPGVPSDRCDALVPDWIADDQDCDDSDNLVSPDGVEACNGYDDDCDESVDEDDAVGCTVYFGDGDGDGDGVPEVQRCTCDLTAPVGYADTDTDCDDGAIEVHSGATEICNGIDDDCDLWIDDEDDSLTDPMGAVSGQYDQDGDGWGVYREYICDVGQLAVFLSADDCDDHQITVCPDALQCPELPCDGLDNDCDATTPECVYDGDYIVEIDTLPNLPRSVIRGPAESEIGIGLGAGIDAESSQPLLAVGAPLSKPASGVGGTNSGMVYVFGPPFVPGSALDDTDAWVQVDGEDPYGKLGTQVAMGDLDDNGRVDLVVTAPDWDGAAGTKTGAVFVFHDVLYAAYATTADATLTLEGSTANENRGTAVLVEDLDCDGVADLVVTAPGPSAFSSLGEVQIYLGPVGPGAPLLTPDLTLQGALGGDRLGDSISISPDPTGDSCAGIVVAAMQTGTNGNRGSVYLVDVNTPAFPVSGSALGVSGAWATFEASRRGKLGTAITAGDWSGDGTLDLFMGAPLYNDGVFNGEEGRLYAASNPVAGLVVVDPGDTLIDSSLVGYWGEMAASDAGESMAFVGDLNHDGISDVVLGAPGTDQPVGLGSGYGQAGAAYLLYGSALGLPAEGGLHGASSAAFFGSDANDNLGTAILGVGDLNGDGVDDMAISAPGFDHTGGSADNGAVYLIYGTE